jgi:hypothetical protein
LADETCPQPPIAPPGSDDGGQCGWVVDWRALRRREDQRNPNPSSSEARSLQTEERGGYTCVQPTPATLPAGCEVGKGNERGSDGASDRGKSILKGARPARPDGWVRPGGQSLASSRGQRKGPKEGATGGPQGGGQACNGEQGAPLKGTYENDAVAADKEHLDRALGRLST